MGKTLSKLGVGLIYSVYEGEHLKILNTVILYLKTDEIVFNVDLTGLLK
jgi:hypothetical protein